MKDSRATYSERIVATLTGAYVSRLDTFSPDSIHKTIQNLNLTQERKEWLHKQLYHGISTRQVEEIFFNELDYEELKIDEDLVNTLADVQLLRRAADDYLHHYKQWIIDIDKGIGQKELCKALFSHYNYQCQLKSEGVVKNAVKFMTDKIKNGLVYKEDEARSIHLRIIQFIATLKDLSTTTSETHFYVPTLLQQFISDLSTTKEEIGEIIRGRARVVYPGTQGVVLTWDEEDDEQELVENARNTAMEKVRANMNKVWSMFPDAWVNKIVGVEKIREGDTNRYEVSKDYQVAILVWPVENLSSSSGYVETHDKLVSGDREFPMYVHTEQSKKTRHVFTDDDDALSGEEEFVETTPPGRSMFRRRVFLTPTVGDQPTTRYFQKMNGFSRKLILLIREFGEFGQEDDIVWKEGQAVNSLDVEVIKEGRYIMDILSIENYVRFKTVRGDEAKMRSMREEVRQSRLNARQKVDRMPKRRKNQRGKNFTFDGLEGPPGSASQLQVSDLGKEGAETRQILKWDETIEAMFNSLVVLKFKENEYNLQWTSRFLLTGDLYTDTDYRTSFHQEILGAFDRCLLSGCMVDDVGSEIAKSYASAHTIGSFFASLEVHEIYHKMEYVVQVLASTEGIVSAESPYVRLFEESILTNLDSFTSNLMNNMKFLQNFGFKRENFEESKYRELGKESAVVESQSLTISNVKAALGTPPVPVDGDDGYSFISAQKISENIRAKAYQEKRSLVKEKERAAQRRPRKEESEDPEDPEEEEKKQQAESFGMEQEEERSRKAQMVRAQQEDKSHKRQGTSKETTSETSSLAIELIKLNAYLWYAHMWNAIHAHRNHAMMQEYIRQQNAMYRQSLDSKKKSKPRRRG